MASTAAPPGWWRSFVLASPARTAKLAVVRVAPTRITAVVDVAD